MFYFIFISSYDLEEIKISFNPKQTDPIMTPEVNLSISKGPNHPWNTFKFTILVTWKSLLNKRLVLRKRLVFWRQQMPSLFHSLLLYIHLFFHSKLHIVYQVCSELKSGDIERKYTFIAFKYLKSYELR